MPMQKRKKALIWALVGLMVITLTVLVIAKFKKEAKELPIIEEIVEELEPRREIIGQSVEGRQIESYSFGNGDTHLLFVGGIHGGYEWNSVLLAYMAIDHFDELPDTIPDNLTITIIPNANPDGVYKVVGKEGRFSATEVPSDSTLLASARFNANDVDLNRNFDCKWAPTSSWRGATVSAGTTAFSEPEAVAIRDFVLKNNPDAVIFWHSQANAVYASECHGGILPATLDVMNAYANAAGYNAVSTFDAYPITGDAEGWLASIGIPAVTVELSSHEAIEWEKNLAGMKALFSYYKN